MKAKLVDLMRHRLSETAVGASAMRRQGAGVVAAARQALRKVDLKRLSSVKDGQQFLKVLNTETTRVQRALAPESRNWGPARKAVNLFLRDCLYNHYLSRHYGLRRVERWLEVPLDSQVAKGLRRCALTEDLPRWPGVKHLDEEVSAAYQAAARRLAKANRIARVHLDLFWWRRVGG